MPYVHRLTVQPGDIDALGHVNNLVYLRWVLDAALAHSAAVGLPHEGFLAAGQVFVVRRHEIEYLRPALVGEALAIETRVTALGAASSVRRTRILREADGVLLVRAVTDWAFVDLARGRPVRIPPAMRDRFVIEEAG